MSKRHRSTGFSLHGRHGRTIQFLPTAAVQPGDTARAVVCQRVSAGPPRTLAVQASCDRCGVPIWVARATQQVVRQMQAPTLICLECCIEEIEADERGEGAEDATPGRHC